MGSKCSILNDTEHDVCITHGINWPSFTTVLNALLALATVGAGATNRNAGMALGVINGFVGKLLLYGMMEDDNLKRDKASAERIKPGEKYTWSGTLSLHMRVYVMNDKLQLDERTCFTGPTADSENVYPISKYFKKLDVKTD